jgi:twitching motility protein PilT
MVCNNAVKNLVREGKTRQLRNVVSTARGDGMQTLEAHLSQLIADGIITEESALSVSLHQREIVVAQNGYMAPPVDIEPDRALRN